MPQLAIGLGLTGVSALAGALGNRKRTATNMPVYSPQQQMVQHKAGDLLASRLDNPTGYVDSMRNSAIGAVNDTYAGIEKRMQRSMTARGFGKSGKLGMNQQALEIARAGELSDLESHFAGLQMNYDNSLFDDATRFGFAGAGSEMMQPGNMLGGASGGAAETATMLFALNKLLGGGIGKMDLGVARQ